MTFLEHHLTFMAYRKKTTHPGIDPIVSSTLSTSHNKLVGMYSETLDVISVSGVMPLALFLHVHQHNHRSHEVYNLPRWEQV